LREYAVVGAIAVESRTPVVGGICGKETTVLGGVFDSSRLSSPLICTDNTDLADLTAKIVVISENQW